jgi:ribulose-5-phosphate 4-epimerase/fuculose-1-phosphate aldolase
MFDEITASNLVRIDPSGKVLDDPLDLGYNEAGFVIHGCMHEARPEINCVIHTHTRAGVAVSAMKCGLLPISQHGQYVEQMVTYHDYEGIALNMDERARMAKSLGKTSKAMILRNHGLLTLGHTVHEAWEMMYYFDCACQIQVDACAGGMENVLRMSDSAAKTAAAQFHRPDRPALTKSWPALLRMLERRNVDYIG